MRNLGSLNDVAVIQTRREYQTRLSRRAFCVKDHSVAISGPKTNTTREAYNSSSRFTNFHRVATFISSRSKDAPRSFQSHDLRSFLLSPFASPATIFEITRHGLVQYPCYSLARKKPSPRVQANCISRESAPYTERERHFPQHGKNAFPSLRFPRYFRQNFHLPARRFFLRRAVGPFQYRYPYLADIFRFDLSSRPAYFRYYVKHNRICDRPIHQMGYDFTVTTPEGRIHGRIELCELQCAALMPHSSGWMDSRSPCFYYGDFFSPQETSVKEEKEASRKVVE